MHKRASIACDKEKVNELKCFFVFAECIDKSACTE